jgi:hypothetical protein
MVASCIHEWFLSMRYNPQSASRGRRHSGRRHQFHTPRIKRWIVVHRRTKSKPIGFTVESSLKCTQHDNCLLLLLDSDDASSCSIRTGQLLRHLRRLQAVHCRVREQVSHIEQPHTERVDVSTLFHWQDVLPEVELLWLLQSARCPALLLFRHYY